MFRLCIIFICTCIHFHLYMVKNAVTDSAFLNIFAYLIYYLVYTLLIGSFFFEVTLHFLKKMCYSDFTISCSSGSSSKQRDQILKYKFRWKKYFLDCFRPGKCSPRSDNWKILEHDSMKILFYCRYNMHLRLFLRENNFFS